MSAADEWLACTDPLVMLGKLGDRASDRKLRLFACAGCRRLWWLLRDQRSRTAVEVSERYADGLAGPEDLAAAAGDATQAADEAERARAPGWNAARSAAMTAGGARAAADWVARMAAFDADLLRDIFGNPFRPVAGERAWPEWAGGTAARLARAIYEERRFGDLPVLADALEETGCTDGEILGHLRGPGPHARGCWVVDLILSRDRCSSRP
jgi:hypothetical protein